MKQLAAITTILLATALVSPLALAKGAKGSAHSPKAHSVRTQKAAVTSQKTAPAKISHQRKVRKTVKGNPVIKVQPTPKSRA